MYIHVHVSMYVYTYIHVHVSNGTPCDGHLSNMDTSLMETFMIILQGSKYIIKFVYIHMYVYIVYIYVCTCIYNMLLCRDFGKFLSY